MRIVRLLRIGVLSLLSLYHLPPEAYEAAYGAIESAASDKAEMIAQAESGVTQTVTNFTDWTAGDIREYRHAVEDAQATGLQQILLELERVSEKAGDELLELIDTLRTPLDDARDALSGSEDEWYNLEADELLILQEANNPILDEFFSSKGIELDEKKIETEEQSTNIIDSILSDISSLFGSSFDNLFSLLSSLFTIPAEAFFKLLNSILPAKDDEGNLK